MKLHYKILFGFYLALVLIVPKAESQKPTSVPVAVAKVKELTVTSSIKLSGTVLPRTISRLAAEVEGRVDKIFFNEGDFVKKGTLLVQIKSKPLQLKLSLALAERQHVANMLAELKAGTRKEEILAAQAALKKAQVSLELNISELKRLKKLFDDSVISLNEYDRARTLEARARAHFHEMKAVYEEAVAGPRIEKINREEANLQAAEERIRIIEDKIDNTSIRAPFSGYVAKRDTEVGEWLEVGSSALILVTIDPVLIEISLPQSYLQDIQLGTPAEVILDNNRYGKMKKKFSGKVVEVIVFGDPASRTFPVRIGVRNQKRSLAPGMMVSAILYPTNDSLKALFVPKDAIVRSPLETIVWTIRKSGNEMKVIKIPVETGDAKKNLIAVKPLKGILKKNDRVVVTGNERLRPNTTINIIE